jgi:hypothetical protein
MAQDIIWKADNPLSLSKNVLKVACIEVVMMMMMMIIIIIISRGAGIAQWYSTGLQTGWSGGSSPGKGWEFFSSPPHSRPALGPEQPPIQWVQGAFSLGIQRSGCEADRLPATSDEVKNEWSYTSAPQYVFMAWCLVKNRDSCQLFLREVSWFTDFA